MAALQECLRLSSCSNVYTRRRLRSVQVRSDLSNDARRKVNTLIITDVHARDIIDKFVRDSIMEAREFAWESQLRFYWDKAVVSSVASNETLLQGLMRIFPGLCCVSHLGAGCGTAAVMQPQAGADECRPVACRMICLSSSAPACSSTAMSTWA